MKQAALIFLGVFLLTAGFVFLDGSFLYLNDWIPLVFAQENSSALENTEALEKTSGSDRLYLTEDDGTAGKTAVTGASNSPSDTISSIASGETGRAENRRGHNIVLEGTILNITGKEGITFLIRGKTNPVFIPLGKVYRIETVLSPEHRQGNEAFEQGLFLLSGSATVFSSSTGQLTDPGFVQSGGSGRNDLSVESDRGSEPFGSAGSDNKTDADYFRQALRQYLTARNKTEKRTWLRLWLTARIVQCHTALMDRAGAIREFFLLCQTDPYTPWIDSIPLQWTDSTGGFNDPVFFQLEQTALPWLENSKNDIQKNPSASLLAASVLLLGSAQFRPAAIEIMKKLAALPPEENPALQERIATLSRLASAQLWRQDLHKDLSEQELANRQRQADLMPEMLRFGTLYLIGRFQAKSKDPKNALSYLLKIPLLYPQQKETARAALIESVKILKAANCSEELGRLNEDLIKFGVTPVE